MSIVLPSWLSRPQPPSRCRHGYAADLPPDALGRFKTAVEEASDALNATIAKMNAAFLYPNISLWLLTVMVDFWDTLDATNGNFDDYRNGVRGSAPQHGLRLFCFFA